MTLGHEDADGNEGHLIVRKHICDRTEANKSASSRWVATDLLSYYRANSNATVENMEDFIMTKSIRGSPHDSYGLGWEQWALDARENSSTYTTMSDRHKLQGAWFHCFFYIAANAYSSFVNLKAMDEIKNKEPVTYLWLRDNEPLEHWARFKFDVNLKCADNTNNFMESFNNAITKVRGKPMVTMLKEIRKLVGARFNKRFQNASFWEGKVTPFVGKKLRLIEEESRNCLSVVHAGKEEFDVVEGCTNFTVKLEDQFCDCKRWQIIGLHCKHRVRCILRMKGKLEDYCAPWFSTENYRKLYDNIIYPISDPCMWGETNLPTLDPPFELRKKGRLEKHEGRESQSWSQVPQAEGQGSRHLSGTKRCRQCKDDSGRLVERYKRKNITSRRLVGRPRKTLRATPGTPVGTSTSIVAPLSQTS
ncbi:hypothetical protein Cgig2_009798 [Carnegiea gigantea]|uniref:SWIM-type domain-containing protein n=1 Tax=Carnegiea gigantea TaxID=171969 RepID=A0A9Q1JFI0_9CARY|nr:hypothetical protein Cgig2_009798 [Carnegiea gigantea]